MKRRKNKPPEWATLSGKSFTRIYSDLISSEAFKALGAATKALYIACAVHQTTKECKQCLVAALSERVYAKGGTDADVENALKWEKGLFVFPEKQARKYGWTHNNISRGMKELVDSGFVEIVQAGKHQRKVNIYKFSDKWKSKTK